jgi:hypothetical protein
MRAAEAPYLRYHQSPADAQRARQLLDGLLRHLQAE